MLGDIATVSGRLVTLRPISREDYPLLFLSAVTPRWCSGHSGENAPLSWNGL